MCYQEALYSRHRGCGHDVMLYYTGESFDCKSPNCALSKAHTHTARNCGCPKTYRDYKKVVNLIQEPCDPCKEEEMVARIR